MKLQSVLAGALASVFVTAFLAGEASADMRIVNDPGGEVSSYVLKFNKVRATGGVSSLMGHAYRRARC
jgi:hypothetical protein